MSSHWHTSWNAPRILISGSVAYDTILVFEGHFKDHILADKVHMINVAFLAPRLERNYGGTAANIAYSLAGLGAHPAVLAAVGRDGDDQINRMKRIGVDVSGVMRIDELWTAQAYITTDLDDNQITAFHPGAMDRAHEVRVAGHLPAALGIISPNGRQAMIDHAESFRVNDVPFVFDPGQALPMFDGDALRGMMEGAVAVTVNDYECSMITQKTGLEESELARLVNALIVTRGGEGCTVWVDGEPHSIPAAAISHAVDPTGCGDAFRAGVLYGRSTGKDWVASARLGSVLGAMKIEHSGAQSHVVNRKVIAERYEAAYGQRPWPESEDALATDLDDHHHHHQWT
jgi:adenosine kinase